jgi:hypothetical protein
MPAPLWLHQFPLLNRMSIVVASTKVRRSVEVLGPVGRLGPPQPMREESTSKPMLD